MRCFSSFEQAKGMIEEVEATGGAQRPDDKMKDTSTSKKGGAGQGAKKKRKQKEWITSLTSSLAKKATVSHIALLYTTVEIVSLCERSVKLVYC